jgi:peptide/nickel transport system substrate-binding protein
MNRIRKLLLVAVIAVLAVVLVLPAGAQDGGIVVVSTFGSGSINFNPVTSSTANEQDVMNLLYPNLLGVNPVTGLIEEGVEGGMAASWEISDDLSTYTFTLREGFTWSDGTPVTANDFAFTWDVIASGEVETPLVFLTDEIASMTALDDYTLEVVFTNPTCEALNSAGLQPLPAHVFAGQPFSAVQDEDFTDIDDIEVGPYQLASQIADQQTALIPATNPNPDGLPVNAGWVQRIYGDQTVELEAFLAGETSYNIGVPVNRRAEVLAADEAGTLTAFPFSPGNSWDYLAMNQANPDNPVAAYDEDGNLVEQEPHPIFADVRVRQALNQAVNVDDIIEGAVFGYGTRMNGPFAPGLWVYNADVPNYQFDQEAALALLAEAGWVDDDNDPSTPLVAQGALNAEDGTPFAFTLFTNQGNTRRTAIGTIVQDQLSQIGIEVNFQTIDFNVLVDLLDQQTFDAIILGWRNSYPYAPGGLMQQVFSTNGDEIGGSNATSYINPEIDELVDLALAAPGCDPEVMKGYYDQITEILHRDVPYIWLYNLDGFYAYNINVQGEEPYPAAPAWNVTDWTIQQ